MKGTLYLVSTPTAVLHANQVTAMQYSVRSIPTILFFKAGELVDTVVGAVPKSQLEQKIQSLLG